MKKTLALLLIALPGALSAQEPPAVRKIVLPSLDSQVGARLAALERRLNPVHSPNLAASLVGHLTHSPLSAITPLLTDERNRETWEQMPEDYYRLTLESGDALIALADTPVGNAWSSIQVRRLCHQRLAALPRASLDGYRRRVDAEARALLEQGRRTRSAIPLRRLVDDLFCSSVGDQALDLLGDLAFERGDFSEANHWWSLLTPILPSPLVGEGLGVRGLRFPDPKVDLVRIEAKQILAAIFQGRHDESRNAMARFAQRHAHAKGSLAGQDDLYAAILQKTLDTFVRMRTVNNDEPWTTFGGDGTRNRPLTRSLDPHLWLDGAAWRVKLPPMTADGLVKSYERLNLTRRVAFHPLIVNHQVLIADHRSVVSYHLTTGKLLFRYDLKSAGLHDIGPGIDGGVRMPRFTLSADQERAYVRLGQIAVTPKREAAKDDASYLVCLDLALEGLAVRGGKRELWHVKASSGDKSPAFFEGSPLVHDGRVYIALSKIVGQQTHTSIVCYDTLGRQRWSREVCDCPEFEEHASARHRQHLLTWAGGQVVYSSNAGAIVAVDAWSGQPTWGVRYASRGPLMQESIPTPRDLAPCVYADGCVYAAPLDSDRLFCIDAVTGQVRWALAGLEVTHLLGVAHGRIYVTTRTGVQAVDTRTGATEWRQPAEGRLPSLGRGLLAGNMLFWPTTDTGDAPCRAVTLDDGQPLQTNPTAMRHLVGNMAFGHGCLAIAGVDELLVFVPPQRQPFADPRPQAKIDTLFQQARRLATPLAYRELLEATKKDPHAFAWQTLIEGRLLLVEGRTPTDDLTQPRPPLVPVETLASFAAQSLKAKRWSEAADAYRRAVALQIDVPASTLGLARAYEGQHAYRAAWQTWTTLEAQFGDRIDPVSGKQYRTLKPSTKSEPYASALAVSQVESPALPLVRDWEGEAPAEPFQRNVLDDTAARREPRPPVARLHVGDARDPFFFCTQPGEVTCRSLADGNPRWQRKLAFVTQQVHRWHDLVILVGADGAAALSVHDGRPVWSVVAPSRRWKIGSAPAGVPRLAEETGGFVHAEIWGDTPWGDSLLLCDDGQRFARLRLDTGNAFMLYGTRATALRPLDAGSFAPHLLRVGNDVLVQHGSGRVAWLMPPPSPSAPGVDGCVLVYTDQTSRPWQQAPLIVGDRVVVPGEEGRVFGYDKASPHPLQWTFKAPFANSLTGELCRLFSKDGVLLALVPRNDGHEWIRIDPAPGRLLWSVGEPSRVSGRFAPDVASVCIGDASYYYVRDNHLVARSLNDGTLQWQQSLPSRSLRWQVRYTKSYLAVWPMNASAEQPFFVGFVDPWKGDWLQRLPFPGTSGPGQVVLTPGQVLVCVDGKIFGFRGLAAE